MVGFISSALNQSQNPGNQFMQLMKKEIALMKRLVVPLVIFSILLFACSLSTTATPAVVSTAPVLSQLPTATEPPTATVPPAATAIQAATATQAATVPPAAQTNAACNEMTLFLDPALASGFSCQSVAEAAGDPNAPGFVVNPKYTEITLTGYILSDRFFTPKIDLYPVQRYSELLPDMIPTRVAALQVLIGGAPTGSKTLPILPIFNAAQEFFAGYQVLPFGSGNGIRFLTQYSQFADPINNHEIFYTYQGLTSDGKYWISAILPISNPLLPADGNTPPNAQSWDGYMAALTTQLNAQPPESYSPTITMLDALVSSISIH